MLEDEETLQRAIERHLRRAGVEVVVCGTVAQAVEELTSGARVHAAVLDLWLPDGRGLDVLAHMPANGVRPRAIVMTAEASIDSAVHAMRLGVVDYLLKPFSMGALDAALARVTTPHVVESRGIGAAEDREGARGWRNRYAPEMIGDDGALVRVFDALRRVASTDCSILVHGETGTGKELVARAIHAGSGRGQRPFLAVNCAAVPEQLMESELFGHGRGAYTGAVEKRVGRFAAADGGTLFLDEIGEMPLALQAKLLRVLQEKEITPLGENKPVPIDVRVLAATHRDLDALVRDGRFREDLLYRLDVIRVALPPLRELRGALPKLIAFCIQRTNERRRAAVTGVEPAAMDALAAFAWPGNVRQLQNVIERAVLLRGDGEIALDDLPDRVASVRESASSCGSLVAPLGAVALPEAGLDLRDAVDRFESALIRQALTRTNWNKNRAAAILRVNRTTLVEKLKKRGWLDDDSADLAALPEAHDAPTTGRIAIAR